MKTSANPAPVTFLSGTKTELPPEVWASVGEFRYEVFSENLGWKLPDARHTERLEYDEFDVDHSLHVVAIEPDGSICGYARLLPTERPYMLSSIFRELLSGAPPETPSIWEMSRLAIRRFDYKSKPASFFHELISEVLHIAEENGAWNVIGVVSLSVERLYLRSGFGLSRIGQPKIYEGEKIVACSVPCARRVQKAQYSGYRVAT